MDPLTLSSELNVLNVSRSTASIFLGAYTYYTQSPTSGISELYHGCVVCTTTHYYYYYYIVFIMSASSVNLNLKREATLSNRIAQDQYIPKFSEWRIEPIVYTLHAKRSNQSANVIHCGLIIKQ